MKAWQPHRLIVLCLALLLAPHASAQIVLSQTEFEAGRKFAAFFKLERGCGVSPTVALEVQIPDGVAVLQLPEKPGWTLSTRRVGLAGKRHVAAVTWRGHLEAHSPDQFGLFLQLPERPGAVYFPAVQYCANGEVRWTDIPGDARHDVPHPAPALKLIASHPGPSDHDHH